MKKREKPDQFDVLEATYQPTRTDDLKPHAKAWIGKRMRWLEAWEIESGPYAGQMAMTPYDTAPTEVEPIGWAPYCDLSDIVDIDVLPPSLYR